MDNHQEFFGTESSIALMKRSAALWTLMQDNPRFAYYGRTISLSDPQNDTVDVLTSIASLLGASVAYYFPKSEVDSLFSELKARGFSSDRHEHYWGGKAAYDASRQILDKHTLPDDLSIVALDETSPTALVADVAALCQSCDVMPVPGFIMRGQARRGINFAAIDRLASLLQVHRHLSCITPLAPDQTMCFGECWPHEGTDAVRKSD